MGPCTYSVERAPTGSTPPSLPGTLRGLAAENSSPRVAALALRPLAIWGGIYNATGMVIMKGVARVNVRHNSPDDIFNAG